MSIKVVTCPDGTKTSVIINDNAKNNRKRGKAKKAFNIATGYKVTLHSAYGTNYDHVFHVPKGAFYGRDDLGYWVCVAHAMPKNMKNITLEVYRIGKYMQWYKSKQHNTKLCHTIAKYANDLKAWNIPVEYSEQNTLKNFNKSGGKMSNDRSFKSHPLKRGHRMLLERRENATVVIKLHAAEPTFSQNDYHKIETKPCYYMQ